MSLNTGQRRSYECSCASMIMSTPYWKNNGSKLKKNTNTKTGLNSSSNCSLSFIVEVLRITLT